MRKGKLRKLAYDMWLADIVSKGMFLNDTTVKGSDAMSPRFAYTETNSYLVKYFIITGYPTHIQTNFIDELRTKCLMSVPYGVKINYMQLGEPAVIDWSSTEMRNKITVWKNYTKDANKGVDVWNFKESKKEHEQKVRLIDSTLFLNEAEVDHYRSICKVEIVFQLICDKTKEGIVYGNKAADELIKQGKVMGLKIKPVRMSMMDWLKHLSQFSRTKSKALNNKIADNIMTDDMVACLAGYKQGRIGDFGIPIGIDIHRREAVLYMFKSDPNKVENWLISAMTGGGKSYMVKSLLIWLLGMGLTVTILDYEGDEYIGLYEKMIADDPKSAVLVSMGKGSTEYVEPMEIPDLVGDDDIDNDLKDTAQEFTMAMFRIIVHGTSGQLTRWEEGVISRAMANVYAGNLVTNDKSTWQNSKGITIRDVYEEIVHLVETKEFFDDLTDNVQHKAAVEIAEACRTYFDSDGARASTFLHPLNLSRLREAQLIIFSFGVKGAVASSTDQSILALKQLCVANISSQLSNYCKYVKHNFNVKVWEEYQRYGEVAGSAEIIGNSMTGGRKRGDINFIITNDLENILDDANVINKQIRQSISAYCIGKIRDADTIENFCAKFKCPEVKDELLKLSIATKTGANSKYMHGFCLMLDDGKKAIVKSLLPKVLAEDPLFSTGVKVKKE